MANVQTTIRNINVKESYAQIMDALSFQWLELTEVVYFWSEYSQSEIIKETKIHINRDFIVEIY